MHKTTLQQWRMFQAVAVSGGFNQASVDIHKSQSSIHHAVTKLEETLGVKLFTVDGRKTMLTEPGRLLLRRAEYVLDEMTRIELLSESLRSGVEANLRLAVDGAFPQDYVFKSLEKLSRQFPHVKIEVIDTVLSGTNELIESGHADIGLSPIPIDGSLNEEICQVDFLAVAAKTHELHQLTVPLSEQDLAGYRQIIVRDSAQHTNRDAGWLGSRYNWTVSNLRTSIDLVRKGMGYAWLPSPSIQSWLESDELRTLTLEQGASRSERFYLTMLDRTRLGPAAMEFLNVLRESVSPEYSLDKVERFIR